MRLPIKRSAVAREPGWVASDRNVQKHETLAEIDDDRLVVQSADCGPAVFRHDRNQPKRGFCAVGDLRKRIPTPLGRLAESASSTSMAGTPLSFGRQERRGRTDRKSVG